MKKIFTLAVLAAVLLCGTASGQRLRQGEQALFLRSGDMVVGTIVDLDAERLVFNLKAGSPIALRDVWMINFVTEEWNFPQERNLIETNEHYIYLKSGDVASGRIVELNAEKRVFKFETGEEFPFAQVRRIYFSKNVPRGLR